MSTEEQRIDALVDAIIDYETACGSLEETTAEGYARLFLGSAVLREIRAETLREAADFCETVIASALGAIRNDFSDGWRDASGQILTELRDRADGFEGEA